MKNFITKGIFLMMIALLVGLAYIPARANDGEGEHEREAKAVGSTLEIHITDKGKVLVRGGKVTAVSGNTISAATMWGSASVVWNINTDAETKFVRRFGGASSIAEVSVGDFISFQGSLVTSVTSPLTVQARTVKDWSVQKKRASFFGTVTSIDSTAQSFVLASEGKGNIAVAASGSTKIKKGDAPAVFADIVVGAKITASGLYNNLTSKLEADMIKIHLPGVQRTTLEGRVKTAPGAGAPTTMVLTAKDIDYTVNISVDTAVLNALWLKLSLASIKVGDKLRVYGSVNTNVTVDATVLRDTSIRF